MGDEIRIPGSDGVGIVEACPCCKNPWSRGAGSCDNNSDNDWMLFCGTCRSSATAPFGDEKAAEAEEENVGAGGGGAGYTTGTTDVSGGGGGSTFRGLDRSNLDWSVDPSDNFYRWSNGGWMKQNPIPPEYPSWDMFVVLHLQSQQRCKELLEELLQKSNNDDDLDDESSHSHASHHHHHNAMQLARFYQAAMNESRIEKEGISGPLKPVLELAETIVQAYQQQDFSEYAFLLGQLAARYGVHAFLETGVGPDAKDSNHCIGQLYQGGLGLPDRDYYFDDDKQDKREAYVKHVALMLTLLQMAMGNDDDDATNSVVNKSFLEKEEGGGEETTEHVAYESAASAASVVVVDDAATAAAQRIFALETKLAESHMTRTENRDPIATYNKQSIAALMENTAGKFDFEAYWCGLLGMPKKSDDDKDDSSSSSRVAQRLGDINVVNVRAMQSMAETMTQAAAANVLDATTLREYLHWHILKSCAPYLTKAAVQANFDFFDKTLSGTQELKPRWKRAMEFTETALGEALGQLYCERYFDETSKQRALEIVESVRAALEQRLKEVPWIRQESTRQQALLKMSKFKVKIGYPNQWIDYSTLEFSLEDDSFLQMVFKARAFEHARQVKEMNAPTNREKWFMTPQTVNAYYHPNLNEIVFPAAILQHPFFDKDADDAVNYGSMGAVVGHEMTHGFDDEGRKFNSEGVLQDWWSEEDAKEYEARVKVMVDQASEFQVHGMNVKGQLTSGENIADLGGLRLALAALKKKALPNFGGDTTPPCKNNNNNNNNMDGFTPLQRFFMAWSQCWRENITKEQSLQLLSLDPHGPQELRCNGPLSNMPEFHEAFQVPPGAPMYKPVEQRVDIW